MKFFDSDIVKTEMEEIADLQQQVYENVFKFPSMTTQEKIEHINVLENLLDRQKIIYTRLSLSDDPEAIEIKNKIVESARMMGMPPHVDMNVIFNNMSMVIDRMKQHLDSE